jgi:hypothetical protein
MGLDKFGVPEEDAYPGSHRLGMDAEIPEFVSMVSDVLRFANGGTPADKDKLHAMGVDHILYAILSLRDREQYPQVSFPSSDKPLLRYLRAAVLDGDTFENGIKHVVWPEAAIMFFLAAGFKPDEIQNGLQEARIPSDVKLVFGETAARINQGRFKSN